MSESSGYRAAHESVALFPNLDRVVVRVAGPRALEAIGGLVTNAIDAVLGGTGCYAFMLDPRGRAIADMRVLPAPSALGDAPESEQAVWLDVAGAAVEPLMAHLARYVPPMFAVCGIADARRVTILGPESDRCFGRFLESLGPEAAIDPSVLSPLEARRLGSDALLVRREVVEGPGFDIYVPEERYAALEADMGASVAGLGGTRAEPGVWDVLRVERGIPAFGSEISSDRLAQDAGQDERAISFEKGCFTGQEVVARIHYRGHVNRLLRGLRAVAQPGAMVSGGELVRDGRRAGSIHTVVESPTFGHIALGYVRREVKPGESLSTAADPSAQIEVIELPFT